MELSKAVRATPLVDGGGGLEDWPGSLGGGGGGGGGGGAGETPALDRTQKSQQHSVLV